MAGQIFAQNFTGILAKILLIVFLKLPILGLHIYAFKEFSYRFLEEELKFEMLWSFQGKLGTFSIISTQKMD